MANNNRELVINISGEMSGFKKAMENVKGSLNGMQGHFNNIGTTLQKTGSNITNFGKGMFKNVTLPIMGVATAIGVGLKKVGNYADALMDLSAQSGLTTKRIQELNYIETQLGVTQNSLTEASKTLQKGLTGLNKDGGKTKRMLEQLKVSVTDNKGQFLSAENIYSNTIKRLSEMENVTERNAYAYKLFGSQADSVIVALDAGADAMDEWARKANEMGLIMDDDMLNSANEFRKSMETVSKVIQAKLGKALMELMPIIQQHILPLIDSALVPALNRFVEVIGWLAEKFSNLSPKWQQTILAGIGLLAVLAPVIMVVGKLVSVFGVVFKVVGVVIKVFKILVLVAKVVGAVIAGLSAPVLIVIGVIAGLIAIGVLLWKNWDTVKAKGKEIWGKIKADITQSMDTIKNVFTTAIDWIKGLWSGMWDTISGIASKIGSVFGNLFGKSGKVDVNVNSDGSGSVKRYAKGGIFTGYSKLGNNVFGEAGHEAVVPLTAKGIKTFMDGVGGGGTGTVNNFYFDKVDLTNTNSIRKLAVELNYLQRKDSRGKGYGYGY